MFFVRRPITIPWSKAWIVRSVNVFYLGAAQHLQCLENSLPYLHGALGRKQHPLPPRGLTPPDSSVPWCPAARVWAFMSMSMYMCSVVSDCATPWTVACQSPLSMGFSRQEYWSGLPFPSLRDLPDLGIKSASPASSALAGGYLTTEPHGKPVSIHKLYQLLRCGVKA